MTDKNKENADWFDSHVEVIGLGSSEEDDVMKELIKKGYLKKQEEKKNDS
jgi:hypothetical protein